MRRCPRRLLDQRWETSVFACRESLQFRCRGSHRSCRACIDGRERRRNAGSICRICRQVVRLRLNCSDFCINIRVARFVRLMPEMRDHLLCCVMEASTNDQSAGSAGRLSVSPDCCDLGVDRASAIVSSFVFTVPERRRNIGRVRRSAGRLSVLALMAGNFGGVCSEVSTAVCDANPVTESVATASEAVLQL